jgi:NAD(P)-dependent dehydrogenase (short-subunit alcohol dehydrogenase family)
MDLGLAGQTAIITGGAGGIGSAVARALAAEGVSVVLVDQDGPGLDKAAGQLGDAGARAAAVSADLGTEAGAAEGMRRALAAFDVPVSILVNTAGICQFREFDELTYADWERTYAVNVLGAVEACRAVLPVMRAAGRGVIIAVTSDLAMQPLPVAADYSGSKAALQNLVHSLAQAEADNGIRVVGVAPGPIATGMWFRPGGLAERMAADRGLPPREAATAEIRARGIPAGRLGEPEEVASAIVYLASAEASYITGAIVDVGGGSNRHIT